MNRSRLGRRALLQSLGLGAAMLPFVPLLEAHAESAAPPKRMVFFFSSNGTVRESWLPTMDGTNLQLSPILAPLERHKSRLIVVDGLSHRVILEKGDRSGHSAGMNTVLTGRKSHQIDREHHPLSALATGISLDQYLGQKIGTANKIRSMQLGIQVQPYSPDMACLSYVGSVAPVMPENSPYAAFDRIFKDFSAPTEAESVERKLRLADRESVLSAISKNLTAVQSRLSTADRIKMEAHTEAIHSIEHTLTTGAGAAASKSGKKPEMGTPITLWKNDNVPALGKLQMDLLIAALTCDLTRVGIIQFGQAGASHKFNWLGKDFEVDPSVPNGDGSVGFHAIAHNEANPVARAKLVKIHAWYADQLAYFLDKLQAVPEGGGTMLDNTVVVWINELGTASHTHLNTPWVIAGNAGGHFKSGGQLVSFPNEPHNRILLSLLHSMGVNEDTFGDPDFCKAGPLTGITT